jgi:trehalose 6-phosphate synthase/phosphatase
MPITDFIFEPLFVEAELYQSYYNGFCNDVLWPLLHYEMHHAHFTNQNWHAYQNINRLFAERIAAQAGPDERIWIHDFHLFLVPKLLRTFRPDLRIGFFLHVPFPSSEIFHVLPVARQILEGVLGADLIAFHSQAYLSHFQSALRRELRIDSDLHHAHFDNQSIALRVLPASINTNEFISSSLRQSTPKERGLFLGVDRLDYIKGIDLKLKAFANFLRDNPEKRGHAHLLQVAIPTRTEVASYNLLKCEIEQLVGHINGEFATATDTPVRFICSTLDFDEMVGLYRAADALLVTSIRDGMNLVALEYVASQPIEQPGVVLLSEFAGACTLLNQAQFINPWNIENTATQMKAVLEMPIDERISRHEKMLTAVQTYTSSHWAESFLKLLDKAPDASSRQVISLEAAQPRQEILAQWLNPSAQLLLVIDYDGTLVPIETTPDRAQLSFATHKQIEWISQHPHLQIYIISGRTQEFLAQQFIGLNVGLVAEHGAVYRHPGEDNWSSSLLTPDFSWQDQVQQIMQRYVDSTPGSFIEPKSFSLAWHYRQSPTIGEIRVGQLWNELIVGLASHRVSILNGKKVLEVRPAEIHKGIFATQLFKIVNAQIVYLGDDETDEDLFQTLAYSGGFNDIFTVKIGSGQKTAAHYSLPRQHDVMPFIKDLIEIRGLSRWPANQDLANQLR